MILVGDSAANVMAGYETTVPITLDMMIYHARSVARAVRRALVVVDLPFGTYQGNSKVALESAVRIMKETEADAVKIEGGEEILESVNRILSAGIPVMGHLGLTPQSIHKFGTYNVRAKDEEEAEKLVRDAHLLEDAGCFAIVLEKIPAALGTRVASELRIPIIGIGAGGGVDGQVLVIHDMLGINKGFSPRFLRRYADLHEVMTGAVTSYVCLLYTSAWRDFLRAHKALAAKRRAVRGAAKGKPDVYKRQVYSCRGRGICDVRSFAAGCFDGRAVRQSVGNRARCCGSDRPGGACRIVCRSGGCSLL